MKKRFVCLLLTLVLSLSLLPVAALAEEGSPSSGGAAPDSTVIGVFVAQEVYDKADANLMSPFWINEQTLIPADKKGLTVSASDYDHLIYGEDGKKYDFAGMHLINTMTPEEMEKTSIYNDVTSIRIPMFPEDGTQEEQDAWFAKYGYVSVAYGPHECEPSTHAWYASKTNHWRLCKYCWEPCRMNWHSKDTGDGKCTVCENELHYYSVTVTATAGGKVEVNKDKALLNDRIDVTVTPDSGYKIKSVTFYNTNDIHSQLTRWEDGNGKYHTVVLPWDVEIDVEFEAA